MINSEKTRSEIAKEIEASIEVKKRILRHQIDTIEEIAQEIVGCYRRGNKLILFGNGGSAADAQHIAAEMVNRFRRDRKALPALALTTDTSILTAIGNDSDFADIFSRQIEAMGRRGDIAVGISTSGNSANVLEGLKKARELGMVTIGFTGANGMKLNGFVDLCFRVPSQITARIQEAHITVGHAICDIVEKACCGSDV